MSPAGLHFLEHYGLVILPALAVAEQLGVPLPAVPALLAVGALAAHGRISIPLVLGAISVAALATDFAWYELGRRRGARVLARLCQLSLEPDSCARRTESIFARQARGACSPRSSSLPDHCHAAARRHFCGRARAFRSL